MPISSVPVVGQITGSGSRIVLSITGNSLEILIEDENGLSSAGTIALAAVSTTTLPAVDPEVEGELWSNDGVVTVSAGAP